MSSFSQLTDIMLLCRVTVILLFTDRNISYPEMLSGHLKLLPKTVKIPFSSIKMMELLLFITMESLMMETEFGAQKQMLDKFVRI